MTQDFEKIIRDPSLRPKTLATMANAYQLICAGEDPWTGLGRFSHAWYGYAKYMRNELVGEPLVRPAEETEYSRRWAAFCAASVEFLCERYGVACPEWVHDPYYVLPEPWSGSYVFPNRFDMETTQPPFAKRNIFCGARLFQNKYELFEWMQEARAKGMTDPHEIKRYALQKEKDLHGA
jgi:hypothetical protein